MSNKPIYNKIVKKLTNKCYQEEIHWILFRILNKDSRIHLARKIEWLLILHRKKICRILINKT